MLVHARRRPRYGVQVPMTSLIDIVFLLLIYFLLTTNFMVEEGIKIKLPQAKASKPQTEEVITIFVDAHGRSYLNQEEVSLERLFDRLKEKLAARDNDLVVVRADRAVILNKAVKVMDIAKAAGAGRLVLATEKDL